MSTEALLPLVAVSVGLAAQGPLDRQRFLDVFDEAVLQLCDSESLGLSQAEQGSLLDLADALRPLIQASLEQT